MRMPPPSKPIYLMTASVFFVGCTASQVNAASALAGLSNPKAADWAGVQSYTRIELPWGDSAPFEELNQEPVG